LISSPPKTIALPELDEPIGLADSYPELASQSLGLMFLAAMFLVSVPVFLQAPLVRYMPWASLLGTGVWVLLSMGLCRNPKTLIWGELIAGFSWTWAAGSLYWGWYRFDPTFHLPIEAIALPIVIVGLRRGWCNIGNFFYLGSLLGTAITDLYFYWADLMPAWRQLMRAEPSRMSSQMSSQVSSQMSSQVAPIFQGALAQMYTPWGLTGLVGCLALLLVAGFLTFRRGDLRGIAFSGAVLSTILVDGLFWVAALLA
jgi:Protein of unknown function (DUF3120)